MNHVTTKVGKQHFILQMKSISTRLAIWYAMAATVTLTCLFAAGYQMLERHLIHGLDLLNASQFEQIKAHLHPEHETVDPDRIEERLRSITEYSAVLFYVDVHSAQTGTIFRSHNLKEHLIPDIKGEHSFNVYVDTIGELRVTEFIIGNFDVNIATPLTAVRVVMEGYAEVCLALLGCMLVASLAIGFWLSRMALRPVRSISEAANHIRSDNLDARIPVTDVQDEVSDLARMLNHMFDRLESSFKQIRRFTAEASHELKTPLSLVRLHAEKMLADGGLSPAHEEAVHVQLEELARLNQIIEELLFLSRAEARAITLDLQELNPTQFLQTFAHDARVLSEHYGIHYSHVHDGDVPVVFDDKRLRQVLLNLLTNSLSVSSAGAAITLRSLIVNGVWSLCVEDEGPGVPDDQHERIFERFVRLNLSSTNYQGNGLGLAICRSIIDLHHGKISATPGRFGRGLRIVIELPAVIH
ncbi:ATP-binding protein [Undibacterium sp. Ji50W]|uniref:ATP-binding protein n=1 Tax=Undibacterium sp. Ji50W TaxID=3413041 RepID=UPI003BF17C37